MIVFLNGSFLHADYQLINAWVESEDTSSISNNIYRSLL